jgi:hypothetical protein
LTQHQQQTLVWASLDVLSNSTLLIWPYHVPHSPNSK